MAFIEKRGPGRWRGRYRGPDGRERSKTFERRVDAERWLTGVESAKLRGEWLDPAAGRTSFSTFAQDWLAAIVHLRPSTRNRYASLLRTHLIPALGPMPLSTIRPLEIQRLLGDMLHLGLSPTTTRHAFVLLSEILRAAQRDGRVSRNPAADVRPPQRSRAEQRYLSAEQVWRLAESIRPRYRVLVLTGAYGALRWGELVGLRVSRLRLLERKIDVVETLVEVGSDLLAGPPKTGARTVAIPGPLVEEIADYITRHGIGRDGLLFTGPEGQPLRHPNFYRREWRPALAAAGLDVGLRIHDLRHTAVALAIASGGHPKEIQELCGHSSITTTLNVYGHLFEGLQDRLADRLGETFLASRAASVRPEAAPTVLAFPLVRAD